MAKGWSAIIALGVELAMLWAYGNSALRLPFGLPARVTWCVVLVAAVIALWGTFLAPRAPRRWSLVPRLMAKTAVFGGAVALAWITGQSPFALGIATFAAIGLSLESLGI